MHDDIGTIGYFERDGHGDIINVYGSNGTTQLASYTYDAFGNQLTTSGTWANTNPIRYCGEYYDRETGLIYLRARYYDSESGRFLTEDPIRDGYNWYSYCAGNPVNYWDPTGYITEEEQEMYENGGMAPAAYTYLMMCTYEYYLAMSDGDTASMDMWHQSADAFRNSGYQDTGNSYWNSLIAAMPNRPTGDISEDEHYFRNNLNIEFSFNNLMMLNSVLPENMRWTDEVMSDEHQNHTVDNMPNVKYVSACGSFEIIYNANNEVQNKYNNTDDMGTFNYYSPITHPIEHIRYDWWPFKMDGYGNVPEV